MKCLPKDKLHLAQGNVLHDWHAEVLAVRAFNRWLVDECANLADPHEGAASAWVRRRQKGQESRRGHDNAAAEIAQSSEKRHWQGQPFELLEDVQIHMYCSEAPCGDASMELTMAAQEDATPWLRQEEMPGRGNFDRLGIVRRKPARPDAPETWSKSCSDKLAMKQCTSLLSGVTSLLVHPRRCYIDSLVLPESQHVATAVERAFGAAGRMEALNRDGVLKDWHEAGYRFRPFHVMTTSKEFEYSRRSPNTKSALSSNLSTMATTSRQEILINGVLQGRKQFDAKGASSLCRRRIWKDILEMIRNSAGVPTDTDVLAARTYSHFKHVPQLQEREMVKSDVRRLALAGWKKNEGDEDWQLQ
ncbi:tRNA-specific adenosine deaminase [Teratosphaeria nubilosa]|uniref:tRNA-specific adenosine deaminase n=1 Tax=Teratosphaeria nubilosa TaxID=161662 RepID=A0A6G1LNL6_9PEZI|nr:tRNA-specific adenosine deaminase [Teratosphaeria nubilosa]